LRAARPSLGQPALPNVASARPAGGWHVNLSRAPPMSLNAIETLAVREPVRWWPAAGHTVEELDSDW